MPVMLAPIGSLQVFDAGGGAMSSEIEQAEAEDQSTVRNLALMMAGFGGLTVILIIIAQMVV